MLSGLVLCPPMNPPSRHRTPSAPSLVSSALTGLILATITSSAILADRLTRGDSRVVMVTDAVAAAAAILVLATRCRWFFDARPAEASARATAALRRQLVPRVLAQAAGALLGILLVHLALRCSPLGASAWLSERP